MSRHGVGEASHDPSFDPTHIDAKGDLRARSMFASASDESLCHSERTGCRHLETFHQLHRDRDGGDGSRRECAADALPLPPDAVDLAQANELVEAVSLYPQCLGNDNGAERSQIIFGIKEILFVSPVN
jgi:hypothetical protein